MITIEVKDAKTNRNTKVFVDGKPLGYVSKIILDMNGGYAEVDVFTINEKGEETARTLVKHGFIVNRIGPRNEHD